MVDAFEESVEVSEVGSDHNICRFLLDAKFEVLKG